jgi:Sulfotransferase domain
MTFLFFEKVLGLHDITCFLKYFLGLTTYCMESCLRTFVKIAENGQKESSVQIRKVAEFLNKELNEEQVSILADHLDFNNMKDNPALNKVKFERDSITRFSTLR